MNNVLTIPLKPKPLTPFTALWHFNATAEQCVAACASAHEALSKLALAVGLSPIELMQQHAPAVCAVLEGCAQEEARRAEEWAAEREREAAAEEWELSSAARG